MTGPTDPALRALDPRTEAGRTLWGLLVEDWPARYVAEAILAIEDEAIALAAETAPLVGHEHLGMAGIVCTNPACMERVAAREAVDPDAWEHIYYCRTCGKTRFVEWLHRDCPPDEPAAEAAPLDVERLGILRGRLLAIYGQTWTAYADSVDALLTEYAALRSPDTETAERTITMHTCWDDHEGPDGTHLDGSPCLDKPTVYRANTETAGEAG